MKRLLTIALVAAAWLSLCGMGLFPENQAEVPKTKENFGAVVYDESGISTRLTHFSIDKETYLSARRGEGSLTIAFDRIKEISFQGGRATVQLAGEGPVEVSVDSGLTAYGLSDYGPYQIKLKKLRRVVMQGKR